MRDILLLLKQKYKLVLGELSIKKLFLEIKAGQRSIMVAGRSLETGRKRKVKIFIKGIRYDK